MLETLSAKTGLQWRISDLTGEAVGQGAECAYMVTGRGKSAFWIVDCSYRDVIVTKRLKTLDNVVDFINECEGL